MSVLSNNVIAGASIADDAPAGAYQIEKSLRFNDNDSAYLRRDPVKGNQRTYTFSGWIKLGHVGGERNIFTVSSNAGGSSGTAVRTEFAIGATPHLVFGLNSDGNTWKTVKTVAKLRDPSAWYHICVAVDTTNSIESERVKIYINGELQSLTGDYPVQNDATPYNSAKAHGLGTYINNIASFFDGYMANVEWIDGLQLSPAAFGSFDSLGVWNPKAFALQTPNDGTTWSDRVYTSNSTYDANATGTNFPGGGDDQPTDAFFDHSDTSGSTEAGTAYSGSDLPAWIYFRPASAIENVETIRVFVRYAGEIRVNDVVTSVTQTSGTVTWVDIPKESIPSDGNLTSIAFRGTSQPSNARFSGIEINGVRLIDGQTDVSTRNNVNDGRTWDSTVEDGFNGNPGDNYLTTSTDTITVNFSPGISYNELRFASASGAGGSTADMQYSINGGTLTNFIGGSKEKTVYASGSNTLTSLAIKNTTATNCRWNYLKVDGHHLINGATDNSFQLKFDETSNNSQLGHDGFVDSTEDTNPVYSACTDGAQANHPASRGFDGSLTTNTNGPNGGGIYVFDFSKIGGVAYTNGVQCYLNNTTNGQYDRTRVNGGSWTTWNTGGTGDNYEWVDVATGSGTMNTFEIEDDPSNSASGAAEGSFNALRINGDTILTDRGGNNFTVNTLISSTDAVTVYGSTMLSDGDTARFYDPDSNDAYGVASRFNMFDGSLSTRCGNPDSTNVFSWDTSSYSFSGLLEVYGANTSGNTNNIFVNDVDSGVDLPGTAGWTTVGTYNSGINKVHFSANGGINLYAFRVAGTIITDTLEDSLKDYDVDSLIDTPTSYVDEDTGIGGEVRGNYCTINPLTTGSEVTLANGNLEISATGTGDGRVHYGTIGMSSGKWYAEFTATSSHCNIGIANVFVARNSDRWLGHTQGGMGWYKSGTLYYNGTDKSYGDSWASGDTIGIAFDADGGNLYFYKNGTIQDSGTAALTGLTDGPYFFAGGEGYTTGHWNFGQRAFKYTNAGTNRPSTDYKCLCTQNLPDTFDGDELNNPSKYFDVKTYTGTGASGRDIQGLNFAPDLVWIKRRDSSGSHHLFDRLRGAEYALYPDNDGAQYQDNSTLTAFNSDGFELGDAAPINGSGNTYVGWAWDAGTAAATASTDGSITPTAQWKNATAGFSITKYTGTGGNATIGHALGAKPDFFLIKDTASYDWFVWHSGMGVSKAMRLHNTDAAYTDDSQQDTLPTNTVIYLSNAGTVNHSGNTKILYSWTAIPGYSAFGRFTGNGNSDGPFNFCGFRPRWIIIKGDSYASNWNLFDTARDPNGNISKQALRPNSDGAEFDASAQGVYSFYIDILSNGFKLRADGSDLNSNNNTLIWAAFAEQPFKTARAR